MLGSMSLVRRTGIPYRVLDSWVRDGVVQVADPATGYESRRGFDRDDVFDVTVASQMWRTGAETSTIAAVVASFRSDPSLRDESWLRIEDTSGVSGASILDVGSGSGWWINGQKIRDVVESMFAA